MPSITSEATFDLGGLSDPIRFCGFRDQNLNALEALIPVVLRLDGDRVHVIEVNAFGAVLGGTLFGWETDQDVLYHGPLTGRFVCSPSLAVTTLIDL